MCRVGLYLDLNRLLYCPLKLFLTRDMSKVRFLKKILRERRPVRVRVFFSKAQGKVHEINNLNLVALNISCLLFSTVILAVIVLM